MPENGGGEMKLPIRYFVFFAWIPTSLALAYGSISFMLLDPNIPMTRHIKNNQSDNKSSISTSGIIKHKKNMFQYLCSVSFFIIEISLILGTILILIIIALLIHLLFYI